MPTTTVVYTNRPDSVSGPLSFRRGGVSRFVLPDLQGHARQLTDSTGAVTDTLTADAWGVPKASSGTTVNPYQAFGQWGYFTDTPSRLYVRARHLRVDLGRWVSRDPMIRSMLNAEYTYARSNPVSLSDPTGLVPVCLLAPRCGPEIGKSLRSVMQQLPGIYKNWKTKTKQNVCKQLALWDNSLSVRSAWDIIDLYDKTTDEQFLHWFIEEPNFCAASPACRRSVMIDGRCFKTWMVNYVLFGTLYRICAKSYPGNVIGPGGAQYDPKDLFSEKEMVSLITLWKVIQAIISPGGGYKLGDEIIAVSWAKAGYRGWDIGKSSTPSATEPHCLKCDLISPRPSDPNLLWHYEIRWGGERFHVTGRGYYGPP